MFKIDFFGMAGIGKRISEGSSKSKEYHGVKEVSERPSSQSAHHASLHTYLVFQSCYCPNSSLMDVQVLTIMELFTIYLYVVFAIPYPQKIVSKCQVMQKEQVIENALVTQ